MTAATTTPRTTAVSNFSWGGNMPLQNGETTAMPPPGQTKQQCNDGTAGDDGTMRRRQSKGPRDVKRHLLGHWQVFFYACFIFFVANNLFLAK
jgi:hypothetical protein